MNLIKYSVFACISLVCSMALAAEWKNPDQPKTSVGQNPARSQPAPQPAPRVPPATSKSSEVLTGVMGVEANWFCDLEQGYNDKGSGGAQDVRFFQPVLPPGYSMLGGYAQGNHDSPSGCVLAVRPRNDASNALLQPAVNWQQIWTDKNSGSNMDGSIWHPQAASPDYVCLGSVATQGYNRPNLPNYTCVHKCLVEEVPVAGYIWSDAGTGASQNVAVYELHNSNSFYAIPSYNPPRTLLDIRRNTVCRFDK